MGVARLWSKARWDHAKKTQVAWPGRATWRLRAVVPVFVAWLCYPCSIPWDFRVTLFCGFKLASLTLLSAKCRPSFRFFDKAPENTERRYMSGMYAKGG